MASTRRSFVLSGGAAVAASQAPSKPEPWYRRTLRWGQTNITEADPPRYDIDWWRGQWKRTAVQGVIINAGGIYAYYPSRYPLHFRPASLGGRDLFGEIAGAARADGLAVLARMDSSRAHEDFYKAQPAWFAVDAAGRPYRTGDLYTACINSPYYEEYLPGILREIIERYHPDGFTDNSWSGLERDQICRCENCARRFRERGSGALPAKVDWDDRAYRDWVRWNYARRTEVWDFFNQVTKSSCGPDCLWLGMQGGGIGGQSRKFRNFKEICARSKIVMLDHQARSDADGFENNAETGALIHELLGWEKAIPESMPMYQMGRPTFRLSSKPAPEARMWMVAGFAGGIQPWWHYIGAYHEDRRMYRTPEAVMQWHRANQRFLIDRRPVASVGVVWSQTNYDFYGRERPEIRVEQPWRGFTQALLRARIPYLPVHADNIGRDAGRFSVLVLPNLAAMTEAQVEAVRRFVAAGGSLVASGETSLYDEDGNARADYALGGIFGARGGAGRRGEEAGGTRHTYLRIAPELRAGVPGPKASGEPAPAGKRHAVLAGLEETDILAFGGELGPLETLPDVLAPLTFVPEFPMYPPETSWMRIPKTDIPGLLLRETGASRIVFLPAALDRQFAANHLPDHGRLLANLVRWAARGCIPIEVEGGGAIDCRLYRQPGRLVLHLVNLTNPLPWLGPLDEFNPVGPLRVRVELPRGFVPSSAALLVAGESAPVTLRNGWAAFEVKRVLDHEVVAIG